MLRNGVEHCDNCGKRISHDEERDPAEVCNGKMTLGVDPFLSEIHDDYTESLDCEGRRHEQAQEI